MPLQSSGQISISQINAELGLSNSDSSLANLSAAANNTDPCNSGSLPTSNAAPHSMAEFYNYDHNCTSGPTLIQCTIAGPFPISDEACAFGTEFCETGQTSIVWTDGASCCPELSNSYYTDANGTTPQPAGWYAACDCPTFYVFHLDDQGLVFESQTCGR